MDEINDHLAIKFEGKVFESIDLKFSFGSYTASRNYYTVKDGVVCAIEQGKLNPSGDSCFQLQLDCKMLGKYNPAKKYERKNVCFEHTDIKKILKL